MTEPTIDEMLEWLSRVQVPVGEPQHMLEAIRAILEQHGDVVLLSAEQAQAVDRQIELEVIRAFVARVEERVASLTPDRMVRISEYKIAMHRELAAMEKGE